MTQGSPARNKPLVFISHDSRDHELAEAFGNLLGDASGGTLKSFRSSDKKGKSGLEFGEEWYPAIMGKLEQATDVVALLTPRSVGRPWILYEAGVAKGKLSVPVHGVAIGISLEKAITGPFAQFQNLTDDEDQLTKLVRQLIERIEGAEPRDEAILLHVKQFRSKVAILAKQHAKHGEEAPKNPEEGGVAKLFEEVKVMFRDLPEQVAANVRNASRSGAGGRRRRFPPMMAEELLFNPMAFEVPDGPAVSWLLFITTLREDAPWLYEPGIKLYNALLARNGKSIRNAANHLRQVVSLVERGPHLREPFGPEERESHMDLRNLPDMLGHFLHRLDSEAHRLHPTRAGRDHETPGTHARRMRKPRGT